MGEHPNVETARTGLGAFMKGDVATMASTIDDDVVWHVPGKHAFSGDIHGKGDVLGRFQKLAEAGFTQTFEEIHDVVGNDEHVVALVTLSISGGGKTVSTHSVQVYHVRDGKMTEFWAMNEDQAAIDALMNA
jgi:ketosteroid isomerase-like protein